MKQQIKHLNGTVLFECDVPDDSGMATRHALEKAVASMVRLYGANLRGTDLVGARLDGADLRGTDLVGARLDGADLRWADLVGARLDGADLRWADLVGARLDGADLAGARLDGANLRWANLRGARLAGARLDGAKIGDKKLVGSRPIFMIGPIGLRSDYFAAYLTDAGILLKAGCFTGSVDEFRKKLIKEHGENNHRLEYEAALKMIEVHAEIWTPKE